MRRTSSLVDFASFPGPLGTAGAQGTKSSSPSVYSGAWSGASEGKGPPGRARQGSLWAFSKQPSLGVRKHRGFLGPFSIPSSTWVAGSTTS